MVYKFFDKKSSNDVVKSEITTKQEIAEKLHKLIIRKIEKQKVNSFLKNNIWSAGLANMQLISTFNKGFRFLLCVIDICIKYEWVVPLKHITKKGITINKVSQDILDESGHKLNKYW